MRVCPNSGIFSKTSHYLGLFKQTNDKATLVFRARYQNSYQKGLNDSTLDPIVNKVRFQNEEQQEERTLRFLKVAGQDR